VRAPRRWGAPSVRAVAFDDCLWNMEHLLLPPWPPTYNLTKSTMAQVCFGPTGQRTPSAPILTNTTGAFLRKWGIVALDFESQEDLWSQHSPKDADIMMLQQAERIKALAPDTRVWVYRNLAQGYANFVQLREKLEDPAYSGWWIKFGPHNDPMLTPPCEFNPRLNRTLCTDLFHTRLAWTEKGHDCGDRVPCGDYVFDHRNQSLRHWLVEEYFMGRMGMGHAAVEGFLIDDWWTHGGPAEVPHFLQGTGLVAGSQTIRELQGNWSLTQWEALRRVRAAGGFTWSGFNCMLDTDNAIPLDTDRAPCGLHKTEGTPRADNREDAPIWDPATTDGAACTAWLRSACSPASAFHRIPTLLTFSSQTPPYSGGGPPFSALTQGIARFLLVRGAYGFMGYGWVGCVHTPPPTERYDFDYGEPLELCHEETVVPGVFRRRWSKADVSMDCNTFTPNVTLHDGRRVL